MEGVEISAHQIRAYRALAGADRWLTSGEIALGAGIAERTAREVARKFVEYGLAEVRRGFPANLYRLVRETPRDHEYLARLRETDEAMGE
jgi:hypothetical protein